MSGYLVLDLETEGKEVRNRFCDPLDINHKVVMCQYKSEHHKDVKIIYKNGEDVRDDIIFTRWSDVLVGQNVKFDLLYLWGDDYLRESFAWGLKVWDVLTVDYLINSCRTDIRYNLDAIAERYGLGKKYDKIKKLYSGYTMEISDSSGKIKKIKIPGKTTMEIIEQEGLEEFVIYAKQDVILTEQIYLKQLEKVKELGMEKLVNNYMNYYITIIETEYNGLYVEINKSEKYIVELENTINDFNSCIGDIINLSDWPKEVQFNINSGHHLSTLLFGGRVRHTLKTPKVDQEGNKVIFKSGKNKGEIFYRNTEVEISVKGKQFPTKYTKLLKNGNYETDSKVIENINRDYSCELLESIIRVKKLIKLKTDIQKKLLSNVNPTTKCLHSEFNTTSTVTGRLSSSNPNSQNLHPKTLDLFTSRWGFEGGIVEFDWSQVEVAMAAYVFKDMTLTNEILNGVDMHLENASLLYLKPKDKITKEERKTAKYMTFGILYGQSAYGLSNSHNIDKDTAEIFINSFFLKYKGIKKAHDKLDKLISDNAVNNTCILKSPTNKQYYFKMYERRNGLEFNSSQYKNYILQGTAGDLHAYCVGKLSEFLLCNRDKCVIVNNVHDSIIFDCKVDFINILTEFIKKSMEEGAEKFTRTKLFKVDVKVGKSWGDCKK